MCPDPGSNQGPLDLNASALSTELRRHICMRFASECSLASKRSKVQILQICNFSHSLSVVGKHTRWSGYGLGGLAVLSWRKGLRASSGLASRHWWLRGTPDLVMEKPTLAVWLIGPVVCGRRSELLGHGGQLSCPDDCFPQKAGGTYQMAS